MSLSKSYSKFTLSKSSLKESIKISNQTNGKLEKLVWKNLLIWYYLLASSWELSPHRLTWLKFSKFLILTMMGLSHSHNILTLSESTLALEFKLSLMWSHFLFNLLTNLTKSVMRNGISLMQFGVNWKFISINMTADQRDIWLNKIWEDL